MPANSRWDLIRRLRVKPCPVTEVAPLYDMKAYREGEA